MSVSTEITRLNNAKSAIGAAITEKGVTVPSGTKLDGMAPLIKSIPSGGGRSTDYRRVEPAEASDHNDLLILLRYYNSPMDCEDCHAIWSKNDGNFESETKVDILEPMLPNLDDGSWLSTLFENYGECTYIEQRGGVMRIDLVIWYENRVTGFPEEESIFRYVEGDLLELADWLSAEFYVRD